MFWEDFRLHTGYLIAVSSDHFGRSCPHFFVAEAVLVFMSVGGGSAMNQQLPALWGRDEE